MDWKETVMNKDSLMAMNNAMPSEAKYGDVFEGIAERQAQITGDIAYEAGREDGVKFCHRQFETNLPEIMECSKQEGMRTVVEWLLKNQENGLISTARLLVKEFGG